MIGFDAQENYEKKLKNWELIKEAHKLLPGKASEKLLKQAEDDLLFAKEILDKGEDKK